MPRPRNPENKGLPLRWRLKNGAYFYQVPRGLEAMWDGKKEFRLGKSLPEAYKVWADRLAHTENTKTVADLLDRYSLQVVPTKAKTTQSSNQICIKRLRAVLGTAPITAIRPQTVYQYIDKRSAKISARREIEILSHAFTKAVEWGIIDRHPFKGEVRLSGEKPRTRYVEDWEIVECLALEPRRTHGSVLAVQAYIRIKLITGQRREDIARMKFADVKDGFLHVIQSKGRGKVKLRIPVSLRLPALGISIEECIRLARDAVVSKSILHHVGRQGGRRSGTAVSPDGLTKAFQELRVKAEIEWEEGKDPATFHELRSLSARLYTELYGPAFAQKILGHSTASMTDMYRDVRGAEWVEIKVAV